MERARLGRHQHVDRLADDFVLVVAENALGGGVEFDDDAALVGFDDGDALAEAALEGVARCLAAAHGGDQRSGDARGALAAFGDFAVGFVEGGEPLGFFFNGGGVEVVVAAAAGEDGEGVAASVKGGVGDLRSGVRRRKGKEKEGKRVKKRE